MTHEDNMKPVMPEFKTSQAIKIAMSFLILILLWFSPLEQFLPGLTIYQHRTLAIFVFAAVMWLLEAVPAWQNSMIITGMLLLSVSTNTFSLLNFGLSPEQLGKPVQYQAILHCFADPTIMLFVGGFILAMAAGKTGLELQIARILLKPFGSRPQFVLLGFLLVTAMFSMFLSNTATAAMMIAFLGPILKALPPDGRGKIGLALAIPIGANLGGMGTPIGTPPNAIALQFLREGLNVNVGFGEWMCFMVPFVFVMLFFAWGLLLFLFPFKGKSVTVEIKGDPHTGWQARVVEITFLVTLVMWCLDKVTGVNANVVAMIPVAVFCGLGIINKSDLSRIDWDVLWMVAGGFALGVALKQTGLASTLIHAVPFGEWSPLLVMIASGGICYLLSNFISNSATAALLVPILAVVAKSMQDVLTPYGGVTTLLIGIAVCASMAMCLPISTPPNAIAHSTGLIKTKEMATVGIIIGAVGMTLGYALLIVVGRSGLFG